MLYLSNVHSLILVLKKKQHKMENVLGAKSFFLSYQNLSNSMDFNPASSFKASHHSCVKSFTY